VGRPARRMNSASRGLWPVVGLRRPGKAPFASAKADARRVSAFEGRFQSAPRPSAGGSACTPNEFGLQGPLASGRPAPTWKSTLCVGGGRRLARSAFGGRFQSAPRPSAGGSACTPNEFGLQGPSADGRPAPTWKSTLCVGGGRRLARSAFGGRFQSAPRPSADGRPAPTWKSTLCVGGGRRLARSAFGGRFQSAPRPSADGRPARRMNSASRGLRPTVGLRRPGEDPFASAEADAWRGAPLEADFNRRQGLRPTVGLHAE
jgi:hypothetical protein